MTVAANGTTKVYDISQSRYSATPYDPVNPPDNAQKINDAIRDAYCAGGGVVYVPSGTWRFSSNSLCMLPTVSLIGDGPSSTLLYQGGAIAVVCESLDLVKIHNPDMLLCSSAPTTGSIPCQIADLRLTTNVEHSPDVAAKIGIKINDVYHFNLNRVVIEASFGAGVVMLGTAVNTAFCQLNQCSISVGGDGIQLWDNPGRYNVLGCSAFGCAISGNGGWGINAIGLNLDSPDNQGPTYPPNVTPSMFSVYDCDLEGNPSLPTWVEAPAP
jgi:hypothetical protein